MTTTTGSTVRRSTTVAAPLDRAFAVFTDGFATWWPESHHLRGEALESVTIEPREGGRWYERTRDGAECDWGRVLVWDPPRRLVLSWAISPSWQPETDPNRVSEVEVRFTPETDGRTRVDLEHRAFDRHGEGGDGLRDAVSAEGGWGTLLARYAEVV
jgi:uncharacterized protein YndB with AHSA1/START domain